jgi:hypothetical protein
VFTFEMDTVVSLADNRLVGTHYGFYNTIIGIGIGILAGNLATGRRGQRTCLDVSRELACELIAIGAELSAERFACAKQLYDAQRVVEVRNERMPGTGMMSEAGVDAVEAESTRKSNLSWR